MLEASLRELATEFGLNSIYVFGSRGREIALRFANSKAASSASKSDVDIAVQPKRDRRLSAFERVRLTHSLEDLLEVAQVDLVMLPEANAFLAVDAVRGQLLYADDLDAQAEEELYYLRRAADLAPIQRRLWQERMEEQRT